MLEIYSNVNNLFLRTQLLFFILVLQRVSAIFDARRASSAINLFKKSNVIYYRKIGDVYKVTGFLCP
jgi:hypothetical protein